MRPKVARNKDKCKQLVWEQGAEFDRSKTRNYKLQLIISWCDRYQYDFLFRPWRRCKNFESLFFPHQNSQSLNSISVTPDLSRHRKHFFNKNRERDGTVSRYFIYFCCLLLNKEFYFVSCSDRMTEAAEGKKLK